MCREILAAGEAEVKVKLLGGGGRGEGEKPSAHLMLIFAVFLGVWEGLGGSLRPLKSLYKALKAWEGFKKERP